MSKRSIIPDLASLIADLEAANVTPETILDVVKKRINQNAPEVTVRPAAKAVVKRHRRTKAELTAAKQKTDGHLGAEEVA